jgi:hypothetical protein
MKQGGSIGIVIAMKFYEPLTNTTEDILAAKRAMSFEIHWYVKVRKSFTSALLINANKNKYYPAKEMEVVLSLSSATIVFMSLFSSIGFWIQYSLANIPKKCMRCYHQIYQSSPQQRKCYYKTKWISSG